MVFDRKKFIGKFIEETKEHLDKLNNGFLILENDPKDAEALNQVFRSAHTIKGSSHILSFNEIGQVAHRLEDALGALQENKIQTSEALFNVLFKAVDTLAEMTDLIGEDTSISIDTSPICEKLKKAADGRLEADIQHNSSIGDNVRPEMADGQPIQVEMEDHNIPTDPETFSKMTNPVQNGMYINRGQYKQTQNSNKNKKLDNGSTSRDPESPSIQTDTLPVNTPQSSIKETLRISTEKLDKTVKLVGEIISVHGRMKQNFSTVEALNKQLLKFIKFISSEAGMNETDARGDTQEETIRLARKLHTEFKYMAMESKESLNLQALLTTLLRDKVLEMRMMPLSTVLNKFPRMVRDLSTAHGKKVNLVIEGDDTELDKKIIEKISDPMVHIIRNCFDHGVEKPDERSRLGKPAVATIKVSAGYEGGIVLIEVSDDGAGIRIGKIKERALKKKILDGERLESMSDSELINFIFRPGFSTSQIITDISGRGVGMDVVRENIVEHLKGAIQINSIEGKGTTFFIRLPLTLAIMPVLFISVSNLTFAIAVNSVDEILRVPKKEIIDVVNRHAIRHHEQIIPVVKLTTILQLHQERYQEREEELILLVYIGSEQLGLIIDALIKEESVEIVPLPPHLEHLELVAGATLSGKDDIITLLNITKIFALAKEVKDEKSPLEHHKDERKVQHILVVDDSINTREIEKSILESYGYKVDLASDGADGVARAQAFKYDLIVTDIEMPRMDGFSFTEKLRQDEDYKNIPIIIVTSRDREEDKRRGIKAGADAYIVKGSFEQSNLLNTVQSLIGK